MTTMAPHDKDEIKALSEELITLVTSDDTYREWLMNHINLAVEYGDVDTLRVYRNLTLHEAFSPSTMSVKYANYAILILRDLKQDDIASRLTPELLHAFETVVKARQVALGGRDWIMGDGNDKLLVELMERPESEPVLLHLLRDRRITKVDQLLIQTAENLKVALPVHVGVL